MIALILLRFYFHRYRENIYKDKTVRFITYIFVCFIFDKSFYCYVNYEASNIFVISRIVRFKIKILHTHPDFND